MPDNMRYDNNGQPMGYGDPMDPSLYGQPDPYGQYPQQGAYPAAMPSPQEIYAQQQYVDPNQMYMDQGQGMYGAQPVQADPYGQYSQQAAYPEQDMGMAGMPGAYPEMDPALAAQQAYPEQDPQYAQAMPGYGQPQQAYPGMQQQYGQVPQAQPMPSAQPLQQSMPQGQSLAQAGMPQQPQPEPVMDGKAAKKAAKEQKRAAQQAAAPANMGEFSGGKGTLCLILGILSVVFALFPPIGIVLGVVVRKMTDAAPGSLPPKAETGRIFATVGLIFSLIMLAVLILMGVFIYAGLYGEGQARTWGVFWNNSPFGNIVRIPIPNPLG